MDPDVTEIIRRASGPLEWGETDCVCFAADVAATFLGFDPLGDLRGAWSSEAEARDVLSERRGLARAVLGHLRGWERVERAEPGDLALVGAPEGLAIAACIAPGWLAAKASEGVTVFEAGAARRIMRRR